MDKDKSGKVSKREFKSTMIATWSGKIPDYLMTDLTELAGPADAAE
tara:strand:- start:2 stop:139 length:138 start_codon:yes stop_codon:yes gene_type:complete